jgi:predicted DNA-binding transcriptional regulator AlpA
MREHQDDNNAAADPGALPPQMVLIPLGRVRQLTGGLSKSKIYSDPEFPQPVPFAEPGRSGRFSRWLEHEIIAYVREQIARRDATAEERRRQLIAAQERKRAKHSPVKARSLPAARTSGQQDNRSNDVATARGGPRVSRRRRRSSI